MLEVFFATNRRILSEGDPPEFGERFNLKGPQELRFGSAKVKKVKGAYKVASKHLEKENQEAVPGASPPSGKIFEALRASMADKQLDVICYVHGFANNVDSALERAAELKDKYKVGGRHAEVFAFCWPSDGKVFPPINYFDDRNDAQASGVAMARAILKLREFLRELGRDRSCQQSIHLVGHSMGNFAIRWALQGLRAELNGRLPCLFDNIFLMAADEDNDAFESDEKLRLLPELAKRVHVYFSPDDRALTVSDVTKGNPDRLGANGPRVRDGIPFKIVLVDCRNVDVSEDDFSNHQYYRLNAKVVADVNQVLAGKAPEAIKGRTFSPDGRSWRIDAAPRARSRARRVGIARDDTRGR
jgi:esterase/lipase superfamily enzyme